MDGRTMDAKRLTYPDRPPSSGQKTLLSISLARSLSSLPFAVSPWAIDNGTVMGPVPTRALGPSV